MRVDKAESRQEIKQQNRISIAYLYRYRYIYGNGCSVRYA